MGAFGVCVATRSACVKLEAICPMTAPPKGGWNFREIERVGIIPAGFRDYYPGAHFCKEWDFMLIWKGTAEWDACLCHK